MPSDAFCPRETLHVTQLKICLLFVMSLQSVSFRQSKNDSPGKVFKEISRPTFPQYHSDCLSYPEGTVPPHPSMAFPLPFVIVKSLVIFFLFAALYCCEDHKLLTLFWRPIVPGHTVRCCLMKSFGHCRTRFRSVCGHILPGAEWHPTLLYRPLWGQRGSNITTTFWPRSLTPTASHVCSGYRSQGTQQHCMCHICRKTE